jgi:hypothetical protein
MTALLRRFLDLCVLRIGPQDLPASQTVLAGALAAYVATGTLLTVPLYGLRHSLLAAAVDAGFMWLYTTALLGAVGRRLRTLQTVTALAGAGTVFNLLALPLIRALAGVDPAAPGASAGFSSLLYVGLLIWLLVVYGHVYRNALERNRLVGLGAAFGYLLFSTMIVQMTLPPAAGGAP